MSQKVIKVLVKNFELGQVKTRLAASIGDKTALEIYKRLVSFTKVIVSGVESNKEVWYSNYIDENDIWEKSEYEKHTQQGDSLGERMKTAFAKSFSSEGEFQVILIGSDCAELSSTIIEEAFRKLESNDLVIGPAIDGGYYLIGMAKFIPEIFDDIDWSTSHVLNQTIQKADKSEVSYALLTTLNDVDDIDDWKRVKEKVV